MNCRRVWRSNLRNDKCQGKGLVYRIEEASAGRNPGYDTNLPICADRLRSEEDGVSEIDKAGEALRIACRYRRTNEENN